MLEKFHHTLPDGTEIVIPRYKHVPAGLARRARHENVGNQMWTFLEELCTSEELEQLDALTVEDFAVFVDAWQSDSRVKPGESKASSR